MLDIAPDVRIVCWRCPQLWQGQPLGQSKPAGLIFLYAVYNSLNRSLSGAIAPIGACNENSVPCSSQIFFAKHFRLRGQWDLPFAPAALS